MKQGIPTILIWLLCLSLLLSGCGRDPVVPTESTEVTEEVTGAAEDATLPEDPQVHVPIETGPSTDIADAIADGPRETEEITFGIDVARYQGTIDWAAVAGSGVDFAMIRVGYRTQVSGEIVADSNAKYNMQEAQKQGIKLGAYFFSTAVTVEEAIEEADWVADYISQYQITYPVAFNCEGFRDSENRQYSLSTTERTDIALAFLKTIESHGYQAMFYASKSEMEGDAQWEVSRIDDQYKIWVAQYPDRPYPETARSSYSGIHHMWQYTSDCSVPGISRGVDVNIAYFGFDGTGEPMNSEPPEDAKVDVEALVRFWDVNESVTAKSETNLRSIPSQGEDSQVLYTLKNGEVATRIGYSDSGWSKLSFNGQIYYAVSSYLTTDLNYTEPTEPDDGIETVFRSVNESVTAKDTVNLRTLPSVTHGDSQVIGQLKNGEVVSRIGISDNGWSKLSWNGTTCYAVSSYLTTDLEGTAQPGDDGIQTTFTAVNEQVTAKEAVNLRTLPSVTDPNSTVVVTIKNGDIITRTGINNDVGWSRVEYNGQTLYCVSSYLMTVE